jgi:cellulose synthase/poly-beta-1,6-N-acetylglucosamine synthase-like glycosyltransferase
MMLDPIRLAAAGAAALGSLPGTIELCALTAGAMLRPRKPASGGANLKVAVVAPAHNEAAGIAACVRSILACRPDCLLVVADNCTDTTAGEALAAGARVLARFDDVRRGKGYALDFAFATLLPEGYDFFIVVDADTIVAPNLISEFRGWFAAGADAVQCRYAVRNAADSLRTRLMNVALLAFNVLRPRGRGNLGLSAGILGNGFAISRRVLEAVPYSAVSVVEDLEYHIRLVREGYTVRFADATAVYGEMPVGGKGVKSQRSRWEGGRLRMAKDFAPALLADVLRGRARLAEPLLDLLLLPLAFHVVLILLTLAAPAGLVRDYGIFALAAIAVHILTAIAVGGGGLRDIAVLAAAPFYVIWKLGMLPLVWRASRRNAAWVRTERAAAGEGK